MRLSSPAVPVNVILLPSAGEIDRSQLLIAMAEQQIRVIDIDLPSAHPAPFATRVCAAIQAAHPPSPVVVVATPISAPHLPAIALAQRRAFRRVTGYALLEPGLIGGGDVPSGADWPDAPVACLSIQATEPGWVRLRGWHGLSVGSLSTAARVLAGWQEGSSFPGPDAIDQFR